ncbi:YcaO-like family protein [Sorangium sp. So ce388]|uniref:YcaO-like family protein n=1 Tax=Sorangium sp. So ce388 TaxID=3133309 RepID=UPI003F5B0F9C
MTGLEERRGAASGPRRAWFVEDARRDGPVLKQFRSGTHRTVPPADTVERLSPLFPVLGITRVANVTGLDIIGVPVVMVCRPNARSLSVSQGKGLDLAAAKASGIMEAAELYHAERITSPLKLGSYNELRFSHPLVDVEALPRLRVSTFHPGSPLLWIEAFDWLEGEPIWVPFELVHTNYTLPLPAGSGAFLTSSNGLASGNHVFEAVSHGICEVVERDAGTLWSLLDDDARRATRVELSTVDDPGCRALIERCEQAAIAVAVWDITSDIGIPVFRSMIAERAAGGLSSIYPAAGMGCHPARRVALMRALTEAIQSRMTMITGSRDDMSRAEYERRLDPELHRRVLREIGDESAGRRFHDVPTWEGETFEEDIRWELDRLRAAGIERVAVIDLTRRELGIPVVRVVIPGLEAIGGIPGYLAGRRARARMAAMDRGA